MARDWGQLWPPEEASLEAGNLKTRNGVLETMRRGRKSVERIKGIWIWFIKVEGNHLKKKGTRADREDMWEEGLRMKVRQ